jgi:hypothetical protein
MKSPYLNKPKSEWLDITENLIKCHPLKTSEIVEVVLESWKWIFKSKIGDFFIGKDIFPTPQIMSFLLHELVALNLEKRHPRTWKKGVTKSEKDLVCLKDNDFSVEIKASSDKKQVFGNRSYAQEESVTSQKVKSGYYLTINFEKFTENEKPEITIIRFGFLEHTDWIGQASQTGQQARLSTESYKYKLKVLYEKTKTK